MAESLAKIRSDIDTVYGAAWILARVQWRLSAVIILLFGSLAAAIDLTFDVREAMQLQSIMSIFILYAEVLLIIRILSLANAVTLDGRDESSPSLGMFPRAFGQSMLWSLGVLAGVIALVVPGLVLMTVWFVCLPVLLAENSTVWRSFGRSYELVKARPAFTFVVMLSMIFGFCAGAVLMELALYLPQPVVIPAYVFANWILQAIWLFGWALMAQTYLLLKRRDPAPECDRA